MQFGSSAALGSSTTLDQSVPLAGHHGSAQSLDSIGFLHVLLSLDKRGMPTTCVLLMLFQLLISWLNCSPDNQA